MVLKRTDFNNGYGCSCCRRDSEESEWIEEKDMLTFEEIIDLAYKHPLEDEVGIQYEKDGKVLYGFRSEIYTVGSDVYILHKDSETLILSSSRNKEYISKEDFIKNFEEKK